MLTLREADVVRLLASGCTYAEIAQKLGISAHTVSSHIKNTYRKLEVHCAAAAVMRAIELRVLASGGLRDNAMLSDEA
jgi:DNA-binding CsgD family transcriptional regulator